MTRSSSLAMRRYSVQPRNQIFVKGYGFLSFARNMGINIGKNISKNLSSKYSQKLLHHAEQSATDAFKTASKRAIQKKKKKSEATGRITKVSKVSPKNNSETNEEEIIRERFIPPELSHEIINDLRLKEENY